MSRHWQPEGEIVRLMPVRRPKARGGAAVLLLGAVFAGLAGGFGWQWWNAPSPSSGRSSAIEWNAVQAVPTRAPDAEDIAWEKRAEEQDSPSTSSGRAQQDDAVNVLRGDAASGAITGKIYVIDGDTFGIGSEHIRILGMDAPETHPPRCAQEAQLGNAATEKLKELLSSGTVTLSGSGHDLYGRELKQVSVDGVDVAQTMIAAGLASSYSGGKKQGWC